MTVYTPMSQGNVPILYVPGQRLSLSEENWKRVEQAHKAAQTALEEASKAVHAASGDVESEAYAEARDKQLAVIDEHLLTHEAVVIDNRDDARAPYTLTSVGASDLKEALQDAIGGFDLGHVGEEGVSQDHDFTPEYVASSHELLAELLADYYSCPVREVSEVLV